MPQGIVLEKVILIVKRYAHYRYNEVPVFSWTNTGFLRPSSVVFKIAFENVWELPNTAASSVSSMRVKLFEVS
jgi:hypothetical protein